MSLAEIEQQILELPEKERRELVDWVYDHEHEIVGDEEDDGLSEEQVAELERRVRDLDAHPEQLRPWSGSLAELRTKLHALQDEEHAAR